MGTTINAKRKDMAISCKRHIQSISPAWALAATGIKCAASNPKDMRRVTATMRIPTMTKCRIRCFSWHKNQIGPRPSLPTTAKFYQTFLHLSQMSHDEYHVWIQPTETTC